MERYSEAILEKNYDRSYEKKQKESFLLLNKINFRRILLNLIGLALGRICIYTMNPVAIAYYAVMYMDKPSRLLILLTTIAGMSSGLQFIEVMKYTLVITMIMSITTLFEYRGKKVSTIGIGFIASISTVILGISNGMLQFNSTYLYTLSAMEGAIVFALTTIFSKATNYILTCKKNQQLSNEEIISIALLAASVIAGINGVYIMNYSILETVLLFLVLLLGYKFGIGIGAASGAVCGFAMYIIQWGGTEFIGVICLLGIVAGIFRELGKIGSSIGFAIGMLMLGNYIAPKLLDLNMIRALASSLVIFIMIPKKYLARADKERENLIINNNYYKEKIQELTRGKLKGFAESFKKLSSTFNSISDKRTTLNQQEVSQIFDELAEKVCINCSMCTNCWKNEFYDTYKAAYSILGAAEKKGKIQREDVPKEFEVKCIKLDDFVETINRLFELFKINLAWQNKLVESRELVAEQLAGVASIIDTFSEEIYENIDVEKQLESTIEKGLNRQDIDVKDIMVLEKVNKRREVYLTLKIKKSKSIAAKDVVTLVSKVLNKKMKLDEGCRTIINREYTSIKLVEDRIFKTLQGVARATKENEKISGDNFSIIHLSNGQIILALSDGMGSGIRACRESEATIELLEEFMDAGFEKDTAIKLINSALVLKSEEQSFSTVDMSIVDLHTGLCEIIKIGAASTFIKRSDVVETIKSTSLPVGVFNKVDFDKTVRKLYDGDIIVMVTDGVIDSDKNEEKESYIEKLLLEVSSKNPQEIADYILEKVKERSEYEIKDDMTVLVSRIWRR